MDRTYLRYAERMRRAGMPLAELFTMKVVKGKQRDDCWIWTAGCNSSGYGKLWDGEKFWGAHRVAWELYKGCIPEGLQVLHTCDIP